MKIIKMFFIFITCLILSGCNSNDVSNVGNEHQHITLDINEKKKCDYKPELYYTTKDGRRIYTYCLNSVKINDEVDTKELNKYLENYDYNESFHDFIRSLIFEPSMYDGETEAYSDGGTHKFTNKKLTLIICGRIMGPKDIYIGPQGMEYKSNFCNYDNATFTRTYAIKKVEKYTEQQYEDGTPVMYGNSFKVVLSQFQAQTKTIIINNISTDLKENETYEFEFINNGITNDDIESIFKKSTIVEIRKTDKRGLDQTQDYINL